MSNKEQPTKTVHALKSPYSEPSWTVMPPHLENKVIDLVVARLTPIGQSRKAHVPKAKRRHRKKRRHDEVGTKEDAGNGTIAISTVDTADEPHGDVTVGFNSTVRHLELLTQKARYNSISEDISDDTTKGLIAVLVCKSVLPPVMTAPLPVLAATASGSSKSGGLIRLLSISQASAIRMAEALQQPRVNVVGILRCASGDEELDDLIQGGVEPLDVAWLRESREHKYQPTQIHSEQVVRSQPRSKMAKRIETTGTVK